MLFEPPYIPKVEREIARNHVIQQGFDLPKQETELIKDIIAGLSLFEDGGVLGRELGQSTGIKDGDWLQFHALSDHLLQKVAEAS